MPMRRGVELRTALSEEEVAGCLDSLVEPIRPLLGWRRALTMVGAVQVPNFRVRTLLFHHGLGFGCWFRVEIRRLAGETLVSGEVSLTALEFYLGVLAVCLSAISLIRGNVAEGIALLMLPAIALFDLWFTTHLLTRLLVKHLCSPPTPAKVAV
jgi:hypothetical protein